MDCHNTSEIENLDASIEFLDASVKSRLSPVLDKNGMFITDNGSAYGTMAADIAATATGSFIVAYHRNDLSPEYNTRRVRFRVLQE